MKKLLALFISILVEISGTGAASIAPANVENLTQVENSELSVIVDRLEDNDYVVTEVCYKDYYNIIDIKQEDFNEFKNEGDRITATAINGKFHLPPGKWKKQDSTWETYYQFKSNDNTVWWAFEFKDLGFIPKADKEYTLIYYDNGTTAENKACGCISEWECECEVYDDIFLGIFEVKEHEIIGETSFSGNTFTMGDEVIEVPDYYGIEDAFILEMYEKGYNNMMVYDTSDITFEMLENRTKTKDVIIERCIGIATNRGINEVYYGVKNRDGIILNTTNENNYISYRGLDFEIKEGTIILTFLVYNPETDYTDDIIERYDFVLDRSYEK